MNEDKPKMQPSRGMRMARNLLLITTGSLIFAAGLNAVVVPQELLSGGVVGVALIIHYLFPPIPMGPAYFVLNIPLLLMGWFTVSRRFMAYSIAGMTIFSLACTVVRVPVFRIEDPILAALLSGVITGAGSGLILRSLGSAGGLDILAVYINKRFGMRLGSVYFAANSLVLLAGVYFHRLDKVLYSIIFLYVSARVVDVILAGFNRRKMVYVISDRSEEIAERIMSRVNRGVTFLKGRGAYSGKDKEIILTITTMTELPMLKEMVFDMDGNAFMVVNDTLEVIGYRHGSLKIY